MRTGRALSVYLSHDEIEHMDAAAQAEGVSRNEAVRRAVRDYRSPVGKDASAKLNVPVSG